MKTVLALGYHDQSSPRHQSVRADLKARGSAVIECHTDVRGFFPKYRALARLYRANADKADAVLVPFPGHYLMPLAWWLTRRPRKTLLFDAFISLYDTKVEDRRQVSRWSPRAWFLWLVDSVSCHLADEVFIDTEAQRQFFIRRFRIKPDRIRVIYLDARRDLFFPSPTQRTRKPGEPFHVFFYGSYIPLQGIGHILRAAKILQEKGANVRFTLVGGGQTRAAMQRLAGDLQLTNVTFLPFLPFADLPALIHTADLCLGIFGTSDKARRVIPHKVYDAVACGVPVLTADSPAIRERFANDPLVLRCPPGDPRAIADAINARL